MTAPTTVGVLLAAGAGRRAGGPKALRTGPDGRPWVLTASRVLRSGGCDAVLVVTGCAAAEVAPALRDEPVTTLVAPDWSGGLSASLRVGLERAAAAGPTAVLVHLVDLPDVTAAVVARVLGDQQHRGVLRRAGYSGRPGHPVLLGADHLPGVLATLSGDRGAGPYLGQHDAELVACEDLATGLDVDGPVRPVESTSRA